MNKQEMAIAVISFDKYSDIWDTFALCINRFWHNRGYKTYLVTNNADTDYEGIENVKTGKEISWSHRVRKALEAIKEEYVMLLLEDYLISKPVVEARVEKALDYMVSNNIDYLRIAPIPIIKTKNRDCFAAELTDRQIYGVNLQAAIWKRDYLLKTLSDTDFSAWEFEARQKFGQDTRVEGKCYATNDFVFEYLNGIIQGKWYIKTVNELSEMGIDIPLGERTVMTDKDMRRENLRNYFLHSLPPFIIRLLKPIAKKLGFKFVT